jgi:transposase
MVHRLRSDVAYVYLSALQQPDFRTVNRFRKDNMELLKNRDTSYLR